MIVVEIILNLLKIELIVKSRYKGVLLDKLLIIFARAFEEQLRKLEKKST